MVGIGVARLVGREPEVETILSLVDAATPLVTVTGAPGVGKRALVHEVLTRLVATDDVVPCVVDLAAEAATRAQVGAIHARAEQRRVQTDRRLVAVVAEGAEESRDLASEVLTDLVSRPGVVLLVPSVVPLGIPGERVSLLQPLACEPPDPEHSPAVRLFLAAARDAGAEVPEDVHELETVSRICAAVDGLPGEIQKAARMCSHLPRRLIEEQLADGERALATLRPGGDQAMARALELIPAPARDLLVALAALSGPFTADDAEQVIESDTGAVVGSFAALSEAGLLLRDGDTAEGVAFRLPRLVRAYGRRLLEHADPGILRLGTALVPVALRRGDDQYLCQWLPAFVDSCLARGAEEVDALTLLESARLLFKSGRALDASRPLSHLEQGLCKARRGNDPSLILHGLAIWVDAAHTTGDLPAAARAIDEGLRLAESLGDQVWLARFEAWQGMILHVHGDVEGAIELGVRSLRRARLHKDSRGILAAGMLLYPMARPSVVIPGGPPTLEELNTLSARLGEQRLRLIAMAALARRALQAESVEDAAAWLECRTREVVRQERWHDLGFSLLVGALLAAGRGDDSRAGRWHGALTPTLAAHLAVMPPQEARSYTSRIADIASALGTESFDAAVRAGAQAPWRHLADEILEYVESVAAETCSPRAEPFDSLTEREYQVLAQLAEGLSNKEIGVQLGISPKTVMHHTVSIYRKLGVRGRGEAMALAHSRGVL